MKKFVHYLFLLLGIALVIAGVVFLVNGFSAPFKSGGGINKTFIIGPFCIVGGLALIFSLAMSGFVSRSSKRITGEDGIQGFFGKMASIANGLKPQNRICKYCGAENKPDALKCTSCGANLPPKNKQSEE